MAKPAAGGLDRVADDLYGLPPREFTAARDAAVKGLRADGDKELAREVAALRRPTVPAWLANQLVRRHPDQIDPLLELGAALREATATLSGPQLRELSRQRGELVRALVRQARRLAAETGQPVSEDAARGLEETLNAALADEQAGTLLRGGRLTEALQHTGFGGTPSGAPTPPRPPEPGRAGRRESGRRESGAEPSAAERRRAERRAELERELAAAWATARAAADARAEAESVADGAAKVAAEARRTAERLRAELNAAEEDLRAAEQRQDDARAARHSAREDAERATRRVSDLQRDLDRT